MNKIPWYKSIGIRLPLLIVLCCVIPVILFYAYSNHQTRQKVMESAASSVYTNLYGSSLLLEELMGNVSSFATSLSSDHNLSEYIQVYLTSPEKKDWAKSSISLWMSQNISNLRSLQTMYLFMENGDCILSTDVDQKTINLNGGWGRAAQNYYQTYGMGRISWCFLPELEGHGGLCYMRPIDLGDNMSHCSLVCEVSADSWESALQVTYTGSTMYVCDYSGEVLLQTGADTGSISDIGDIDYFQDALKRREKYSHYLADNGREQVMVMYYNSVENGWRYLVAVPVGEIYADLNNQMIFPYLMIIISIISAIAAATVLTRSVVRPLQILDDHMDQMEKGDLVPIDKIRQKDEVGAILNKYNHMIGQLKSMIDEVYVQQLLRKQAQLSSLQSQLDEHFLYNTLNTIYCEARKENADRSSHMLLILSRYFRLSLAEGKEMAPLNEIMDLIRYYLSIQKTRFGEDLQCHIETFPDMEQYVALKYLFQPIVENAIVHGFEKKLGDHTISIIMRKETDTDHQDGCGDILFFSVEDDGNGIPEDQLNSLLQEMHTFERVEGKGYALKNIREQIRITYGEQYTISIESTYGKGTRVYFRIPLKKTQHNAEGEQK